MAPSFAPQVGWVQRQKYGYEVHSGDPWYRGGPSLGLAHRIQRYTLTDSDGKHYFDNCSGSSWKRLRTAADFAELNRLLGTGRK